MRHIAKKSLGQNFLKDKNLINKIVSLCDLKEDDSVLEIGPGLGDFTEKISPCVKSLSAVEIDKNLCLGLENKMSGFKNFTLHNCDILKFEFPKTDKKFKVIGNIPYYITTPIISYLIENRQKINFIYLMLQKELAHRIIALKNSPDYSSFSLYVQYYLKPKILLNINRAVFSPKPKVDSAFVRFEVFEKSPFFVKDEALFRKIIRQGFAYRRKMLRNNLQAIFSKEAVEEAFSKAGFKENLRAQELSVEEFATLSNLLGESAYLP